MNNKDKITAMCHKVSAKTGLTFNSVMTYYFLESVLSRLSNSKYNSIQYELKDIQEIKKEDEYSGYRVWILCKYEYKTIFLEDNLRIQAYNLETMLAEKLETIYSKVFLNSRSKDFYDVHLLYRLKSDEIDFDKLAVACERTFNYRETILDLVSLKLWHRW